MSITQSDIAAGGQRSVGRWNSARDSAAAVLLTLALALPWNLSFGVGIPDGSTWPFAPLTLVTLSSWASLAASHIGRRASRGGLERVRLALNAPYLLFSSAFVVFAYLQVIQYGGTGDVPSGIGPGLIAGTAGALLAAQPMLADRPDRWQGTVRVIGFTSIGLATVAVGANTYLRTRYPVGALADGIYGGQNIAVVATVLVYGAVAWLTVLVGLRWLLSDQPSARLAIAALGISTILGSVLVWVVPVGRDIDAFHGIAQTTSTAAVGFEGYLPWAAAAAVVAPWALWNAWSALPVVEHWRDAVRRCLALIALWCAGSALLRVFDMIVSLSLDMPFSPYDSVAMLAFDIVTAVAALWIRHHTNGAALHPAVLSAGAGVLVVLTICRVVVGVGLAPQIMYSGEPPALHDAAYGNMLAQQITSTFDVVVCWLALAAAVATVLVLQLGGLVRPPRTAVAVPKAPAPNPVAVANAVPAVTPPPVAVVSTPSPSTAAVPEAAFPTTAVPAGPAPKIARSEESATKAAGSGDRQPKIARVLEESTQRFAAGTTYSGTGSTRPPADG